MQVTGCQVFMLKEPCGKTRALARCLLDDQLQLTGLRVVLGANGLFLSYPNDPGYKGEDYRSLFYPVTKDLRNHIEDAVLTKYREMVDGDEVTSLEVYDFLLKQKWLSKKERVYLEMVRHSYGPSNLSSLEKDIRTAQCDIVELKRKQKIVRQGIGDTLKTKITVRYGARAPQMLDDEDKERRAIAQCILKDLPL